ncbi:MAG TPA: primosomal protein N' [Planctomycetota bacterium]|nr:primosomal protein N' [Planctomycetota bacterium]
MPRDSLQAELFGDAAPAVDTRRVAEVAVAAPIRTPLTYAVADDLDLAPGVRVRVPLGARRVEGFVVAVRARRADETRLKPVAEVADPRPLLNPATLALGLWMAERYAAAPGECFQTVVPAPVRHGASGPTVRRARLAAPSPVVREEADRLAARGPTAPQARLLELLLQDDDRLAAELEATAPAAASTLRTLKKKGLVEIYDAPAPDDALDAVRPRRATPPQLTDEQAAAVDAMTAAVAGGGGAFLLHGVTGSGKTEVYVRVAEAALRRGRGVIVLVPEIALTPQTVERFRARLGDVAVLHSNQSDGARARRWEDLRSGRVRVALGPRSALFAPIDDVGAILVDEEHEGTFKQQNAPRYHARDVALRRGAAEGAVVVLGSATPSLEAERLADQERLVRLRLTRRTGGAALPDVRLVDLRREKPVGPGGLFSTALFHQTREALARGEQALLFLNRLGFSTQLLCKRCGWRGRCVQCEVNLTYHRETSRLLCHYCGAEATPPARCPDCGHDDVKYRGAGAEKVAEAATALFPGKRVARMDGETLQARGAAERIYDALRNREIDVLVGTQSVAKGLDLPGITLIGVINADTSLLLPDFRAAERTFQLLCQVAGRAGRGDRPGRVLIQTYEPDHYALRCAVAHDHDRFAAEEMRYRRAAGYPPYAKLVRVVFEGVDDARVEATAAAVAARVAQQEAVQDGRVRLLGPAPCPIPRLQSRFRRHLMLKSVDDDALTSLLPAASTGGDAHVRLLVDRDPTGML